MAAGPRYADCELLDQETLSRVDVSQGEISVTDIEELSKA